MAVRLTSPPNPQHLPEHVLWTMRKGGRIAEARTRMVPIGDGLPELRVYMSNGPTVKVTDLLWSQTLKDGRDAGALAEERKSAFLSRGWAAIVEQTEETNRAKRS